MPHQGARVEPRPVASRYHQGRVAEISMLPFVKISRFFCGCNPLKFDLLQLQTT